MAHPLRIFWPGLLPDALPRIVVAALGRRFGARTHERRDDRHGAGPLDAATMRDVGARRESLDYATAVRVSAGSARRLHRIADAGRWTSPR